VAELLPSSEPKTLRVWDWAEMPIDAASLWSWAIRDSDIITRWDNKLLQQL